MKHVFRAFVFLAICQLLIACGQSVTATPSPIPSPSETFIPTFTFVPTQTPTATITPAPTKAYLTSVRPSPIPTIDPTFIPDLLRNAFSIQTIETANGISIRQIAGWGYGFGGGVWTGSCGGFYWLDERHLLLYPAAGEVIGPEGYWADVNVVPQPVIINVDNGATWMPPVNQSVSPLSCSRVYWSRQLGILITPKIQNDIPTVSTYTYDGKKLASYSGNILSISPSRTKIILADNILIDLRTNKAIKLNWSLDDYHEQIISDVFWTYQDETRLYRCCYFYADLNTGTSYRFERSDLQYKDGSHANPEGSSLYNGQWVRNESYFLVEWSWVDDGDKRYIPMFDPASKLFYDVREMAGISEGITCPETDVSSNGKYLWIMCYETDYLVNLSDFETTTYPGYSQVDIDWSDNGQFAWLTDFNTSDNKAEILSVSDKKLSLLPVTPAQESEHWWHPTDSLVVYPAKDRNFLIFLDASTMSIRELPFKNQGTIYKISNLAWNPNGDKIAFVTEGRSLWLVDYPSLENLEQILSTVDQISNMQWSPDGNSISFISGSIIDIVNITK